jgi:hypothetical protein
MEDAMCNNMGGGPVRIMLGGKEYELMTLEELYVRCATTKEELPSTKGLDDWLGRMGVVLAKTCYDRLKELMNVGKRLDFANDLIKRQVPPFQARREVAEKGDRDTRCYWPECK